LLGFTGRKAARRTGPKTLRRNANRMQRRRAETGSSIRMESVKHNRS
jgi:hypothetical protein